MRVLSDGRVRRTEAEWRSILERFERSGLSVSAFCRRSKISRGTFVKRKKQLSTSTVAPPAFVEWIAPSAESETPSSSGEFELQLPGGAVLRWKA